MYTSLRDVYLIVNPSGHECIHFCRSEHYFPDLLTAYVICLTVSCMQQTLSQTLKTAWNAAWNQGNVEALERVIQPRYVRVSRHSGQATSLQDLQQDILAIREAF